ncbi:NAC domain-containing protein 71 [Linum perenne]
MAAAAVANLRNFDPSDDDLIDYLQLKLRGEIIPNTPSDLVPEIDIYGELNPWEMFDKNADRNFYAFARLKKRGGKRFHRTAGSGTWDCNSSEKIRGDRFLKRYFVYKATPPPKNDDDLNGCWSMKEFSLVGAVDNDFVICRVENKCRKQRRRGGRVLSNSDLTAAAAEEAGSGLDSAGSDSGTEFAAADLGKSLESSEEAMTEDEKFEEFDFESKEEILALTRNFWSEPPGNIWKTMSWDDDVLMF